MAMRSFGVALVVVVVVVVVGSAAGDPDTTIISANCNDQKIPSGDPFFETVGSLLIDLEQNHEYMTSNAGSGGSAIAYGHSYCNKAISQSDCTACLKYIGDNIWGMCSDAIGAQVYLADCNLRYEQYSFYLEPLGN